jgi:hypothetical protein
MALFAPRKLSRSVGESPMVKQAQAVGFALAEIKEWDEVCRSGEPVAKIAISYLRDHLLSRGSLQMCLHSRNWEFAMPYCLTKGFARWTRQIHRSIDKSAHRRRANEVSEET